MELWKTIPFAPDYEASTLGNLRSKLGQVIPKRRGKGGYITAKLWIDGDLRSHLVHWVILETFICPRFKGAVVCHINDIPDDNRLVNLVYGNQRTNGNHRSFNLKHVPQEPRAKAIVAINHITTNAVGRQKLKRSYYWKVVPQAPGYVSPELVKQIPGMAPGWCE